MSQFVTIHEFSDKLHTKERFLVNWSSAAAAAFRFSLCPRFFVCLFETLRSDDSTYTHGWSCAATTVEARKLLSSGKLESWVAKVRTLMFFTSIFQWFISGWKIRRLIPYFSPVSVSRARAALQLPTFDNLVDKWALIRRHHQIFFCKTLPITAVFSVVPEPTKR